MPNKLLILALLLPPALAQTVPTVSRAEVYEAALAAERYVVLSLEHDGPEETQLVEALISSPVRLWLWAQADLGRMAKVAGKHYLGPPIGVLVIVDGVGYVYYPELEAFVQIPAPIVRLTLERLGIAEEVYR